MDRTECQLMSVLFLADAAALSAPVVMVLLISVVILLGVRMGRAALGISLTRLITNVLDVSIVLTFIIFMVFFVLRFRIIG